MQLINSLIHTGETYVCEQSNSHTYACHAQIFGGADQDGKLLSDLWYIDTSLFSEAYTPAWILLTPSSSQAPGARHSMGMATVGDRIVVTGGWVRTTGSGSLRSNDVWILDHRARTDAGTDKDTAPEINSNNNGGIATDDARPAPTWTSLIPEGVPYALAARSNLAVVGVGVTVAVLGGEGNTGALSDLQHLDLCSAVECGPGFKSTCDWDVTSGKRGACIACADNENCCRAATHTADEGICQGMRVTLNSCAPTDAQWDYLMQAFAVTVFLNATNCRDALQEMCASIQSPGIPQGSVRQNPLLCQRPFLCASDSPFGSMKFAQTSACGVQGTQCVSGDQVYNRPNRVCCSYVEHLIAQSCNALPAEFVRYLARSRFPTCRDVNCYSPAVFQITATALNHDTTNAGYFTTRGPSARDGITAAVIGTSVLIYGGYTRTGEYSKELWELDAAAYPPKWIDFSSVRGGPTGRRYAAVVALEPAGKMLVHAGEGPEFLLDDLYVLDMHAASLDMPYKWIDLTNVVKGDVPSERCMHAMVGVGASEAYVFGGKTLMGVSDEVSARTNTHTHYIYTYIIYTYIYSAETMN
jgi:hypothetical protein